MWGPLAALGGVAGSLCLYAALSRATFTVAVGASTVTTTVTPALVAMALLGEEATPLRLVLVGLAVLTVWLLVPRGGDGGLVVLAGGFSAAGMMLFHLSAGSVGLGALSTFIQS